LAARIVSICDVYDALSSRRIYKAAMGHDQCVEIIRREAGMRFDPGLVEVWLTITQKFRDIRAHFGTDPDQNDMDAHIEITPGEYEEQSDTEPAAGDDTEAKPELANTNS
ncbi:MAG: hypothetical protein O7B26_04725, partial [Planctomycetota bacterium]|nr:hypothetical protein [Planctomycetota bacterium]